jgi:O-antigen ligase
LTIIEERRAKMTNDRHEKSNIFLLLKERFDRFLYSPFNILVWAIIAAFTFVYSRELVFYTAVAIYGIYVIIFCHDLTPTMPQFALCYVTVSTGNNPGSSEESVFYGQSSTFILCLAAAVVMSLIIRISFDRKIGWKAFIIKRRQLLPGILILSLAYIISGIGSEHYLEYVKNNLIFALIQALSICLLYFVFSATIDWENFNVDYFAYIELITGFVVLFELIWVYFTSDVIVDGEIARFKILTGWGVYNNIGAMIAIAIPFAFYLACRKKHGGFYLILAIFFMIGVIFSCSRASIVCASISFLISFVYTFIKANNKKEFRIFSIIIFVALAIFLFLYHDTAKAIFEKVPQIVDVIDGKIVLNDSSRLDIYTEGWKAFLKKPIFGQSFYSIDYELSEFSTIDKFSSLFPPRWHNTFIQLLASCGAVGLGAYLFHRYQTVRLFIKRRSVANVYIGIFILTLLCLSLLDCHFFNVGPVLVYSMALAVMEYNKTIDT